MRPTLRQLQYLVAIAETGRFSDAARRLNVSQPSLSAQVAEVEAELGAALIERGRRGAVMTPIGEAVVQRARRVLSDVEDLKLLARQSLEGLFGRMRLGVLASVGPYLLPNVTKRLHTQYPEFRMAVREERTIDLEAHLQDGQLDTVISTLEDHPGRSSMRLFDERLWICAAPDDVLSQDTAPVQLSDLKGRGLLSLGYGHRLTTIIEDLARQAEGYVSMEYQGTSLDAIRQMAIMGAGVAILPSLYATSEARRDPDLVVRLIDHPGAARTVSLIWRSESPLTQPFETLGEVLSDVAQDLLSKADRV
ncbi:MAG: LysR substrate-binding domain-containing protein [Maricaulaceae bacterium]